MTSMRDTLLVCREGVPGTFWALRVIGKEWGLPSTRTHSWDSPS